MRLPAPMLPTAGGLPDGDGWRFEVKWDGVRAVAAGGRVRVIRSRRGFDLSDRFPEVLDALDSLPSGVVDGELVVCGADGRPDFAAVHRRLTIRHGRRLRVEVARWPATLVVFDLLADGDRDLTGEPWQLRRQRLEALGVDGGRLAVNPVYEDGAALWEAVCARGLEGVVAKRLQASYRPGRRTGAWVKTKHTVDSDHVVVGIDRRGGRRCFLLAQAVGAGGLAYSGSVELATPQLADTLIGSLQTCSASALGWVNRRVQWVQPDTWVTVRALACGQLREGRIVALTAAPAGHADAGGRPGA